jgi:hypothetical protein
MRAELITAEERAARAEASARVAWSFAWTMMGRPVSALTLGQTARGWKE